MCGGWPGARYSTRATSAATDLLALHASQRKALCTWLGGVGGDSAFGVVRLAVGVARLGRRLGEFVLGRRLVEFVLGRRLVEFVLGLDETKFVRLDDGSSSSSSDEGARWRRTMKNHEGSCPGGIGNSGCLGRSGWPMRLSRAKTRRRSSRRCTNTLLAMLRGAVQTRCARRRRASAASGHCQCASGLAGGWASSCRPAARVDVRKKLASAAISRMCSTVAPALPPAPLPLRGNLPRGRSGSVRLAGRERSLREGCEINGKKLELACGTTVQIMGQMVFICGTKDERERVRHIVAVLLMEKSYVG